MRAGVLTKGGSRLAVYGRSIQDRSCDGDQLTGTARLSVFSNASSKVITQAAKFLAALVHDVGILVAKLPDRLPPHGYDLSAPTQYATVRRYEDGSSDLTAGEIEGALTAATSALTWAQQEIGT